MHVIYAKLTKLAGVVMILKILITLIFSICSAGSLFADPETPTPAENLAIFPELSTSPCEGKLNKEQAIFLSKKDVLETSSRYITEGGRPTTYNISEVNILNDSVQAYCEVPPHFMESVADPLFYLTNTTAFQLLEEAAKDHFDHYLKHSVDSNIQFARMHTGSFTFQSKKRIADPVTGLALFLIKKEIIPAPIPSVPETSAYSYTWLYDIGNGAIKGEITFSFIPVNKNSPEKTLIDSSDTRRISPPENFIAEIRRLGAYRINKYENPVTKKVTLRLEKFLNGSVVESEKIAIDPLTGLVSGNTEESETIIYTLINYAAEKADLYKTVALSLDVNLMNFTNEGEQKHGDGDVLLAVVGEVVRNNLRPGDIAMRKGGDELLILLDKSNENEGRIWVKRVQEQIANHPRLLALFGRNAKFFTDIASFVSKHQNIDQLKNNIKKLRLLALFDRYKSFFEEVARSIADPEEFGKAVVKKSKQKLASIGTAATGISKAFSEISDFASKHTTYVHLQNDILDLRKQLESEVGSVQPLAFDLSYKALSTAHTRFGYFQRRITRIAKVVSKLQPGVAIGVTLIRANDRFSSEDTNGDESRRKKIKYYNSERLKNIILRAEKFDPAYQAAKDAAEALTDRMSHKDLRWIVTPFSKEDANLEESSSDDDSNDSNQALAN